MTRKFRKSVAIAVAGLALTAVTAAPADAGRLNTQGRLQTTAAVVVPQSLPVAAVWRVRWQRDSCGRTIWQRLTRSCTRSYLPAHHDDRRSRTGIRA